MEEAFKKTWNLARECSIKNQSALERIAKPIAQCAIAIDTPDPILQKAVDDFMTLFTRIGEESLGPRMTISDLVRMLFPSSS